MAETTISFTTDSEGCVAASVHDGARHGAHPVAAESVRAVHAVFAQLAKRFESHRRPLVETVSLAERLKEAGLAMV